MSGSNPIPRVDGFPQARTYAEYQAQRQHQQALLGKRAPADTTFWTNKLGGMGMGFGMGLFVGGSVGMLHGFGPLLTGKGLKEPVSNIVKRSVAGGTAFGVIFAMGSLVR